MTSRTFRRDTSPSSRHSSLGRLRSFRSSSLDTPTRRVSSPYSAGRSVSVDRYHRPLSTASFMSGLDTVLETEKLDTAASTHHSNANNSKTVRIQQSPPSIISSSSTVVDGGDDAGSVVSKRSLRSTASSIRPVGTAAAAAAKVASRKDVATTITSPPPPPLSYDAVQSTTGDRESSIGTRKRRPAEKTNNKPAEKANKNDVNNNAVAQREQPTVAHAQEKDSNANRPISPGRSAHFSNRLSVTSPGDEVLHNPPPRSLSPYKSAMKHPASTSLNSNSPRPVPSSSLSEMSDGTSVASDEGSKTGKKRGAKVSFDDEAEVVGAAMSSPPTSPEDVLPPSSLSAARESSSAEQKKKRWISLGKKKNNILPLLKSNDNGDGDDDDFEHVMKPRPTLPSFGSVREDKKVEHRPATLPPATSTAATTTSTLVDSHSDTESGSENSADANQPSRQPDAAVVQDVGGAVHDVDAAAIPDADRNDASPNGHLKGIPSVVLSEDVGGTSTGVNDEESNACTRAHDQTTSTSLERQQDDGKVAEDKFDESLYKMPGDFPPSYPASAASVPTDLAERSSSTEQEQQRPSTTAQTEKEKDGANVGDDDTDGGGNNGVGSINAIVDGEAKSLPIQEKGVEESISARSAVDGASLTEISHDRSPAASSSSSEALPSSQVKDAGKEKGKQPIYVNNVNGGSRSETQGPDIDGGLTEAQAASANAILSNRNHHVRTGSPDSASRRRRHVRQTMRTNGMMTSRLMANSSTLRAKPSHNGFRFTSRFEDSDDEDVGSNRLPDFRSRFEDSSDDDDDVADDHHHEGSHHLHRLHILHLHHHHHNPHPHQPQPQQQRGRTVRGIPRLRAMHDGDSTELEDSSEDEQQRPAPPPAASSEAAALAAIARSRGMTPGELDDFLHRSPSSPSSPSTTTAGRKNGSGFFGRLHMGKSDKHGHHHRKEYTVDEKMVAADGGGGGGKKEKEKAAKKSSSSSTSPKLQKRVVADADHILAASSNSNVARGNEQVQSAGRQQQTVANNNINAFRESEAGSGVPTLRNVAIKSNNALSSSSQKKPRFAALRKAFGLRS